MALSKIVMHLARNPQAGFAEGDRRHGYLLIAPLTRGGLLDEAAWRERKAECIVRAFAPGEALRDGQLARRGHNWFFDYDHSETDDDEPVFKLEQHTFAVGEYVTIRDKDETPLVYRIDSVEPVS
ncbi:MAG: hypothetical protein DCF16_06080 [Alphaproteobacteria bacterium]|nr:MAG: hypothetical protein DCF16_06080 [Alphaproteobacteria bacterium]